MHQSRKCALYEKCGLCMQAIYRDFSSAPWQKSDWKLKPENWGLIVRRLHVRQCTIIHLHTPWQNVSYPLAGTKILLYCLPRGIKEGLAECFVLNISGMGGFYRCQCQGVNANHYIARKGACCIPCSIYARFLGMRGWLCAENELHLHKLSTHYNNLSII